MVVGRREKQESAGVAAKLDAQINAFETLGHAVWYTLLDGEGGWLCHEDEKVLLCPYKTGFPAAAQEGRNAAQMLLAAAMYEPVDFDLAYIRKPLCDAAHLKALKLLKQRGVVIVEEIPSFPYDAELKAQSGIGAKAFLAIDRHYRKKLPRYVDFFANFNKLDTIWGVLGILIENMVVVDSLPLHIPPPNTGEFHIIGVAAMLFWHGFDRVIQGLAAYNKQGGGRRVVLHLVGDGPQRAVWQQLAETQGVAGQVIFHGTVTGSALNTLFEHCHMAVSTLAWHRRGFYHSYALKTREYIARGIPFIYASDDTAASGVAEYCVQLPPDDSDVNIAALLDFYESIQGIDYPVTMRRYAQGHLQWTGQMQRVVDAYNSLNNK